MAKHNNLRRRFVIFCTANRLLIDYWLDDHHISWDCIQEMNDRSRHMYIFNHGHIMDVVMKTGGFFSKIPNLPDFLSYGCVSGSSRNSRVPIENPLPVIGPLGSRKTDSMICFHLEKNLAASMWRLRLQCDVEPMLEPAGEDPVWIFVVDPEPGGWTSPFVFDGDGRVRNKSTYVWCTCSKHVCFAWNEFFLSPTVCQWLMCLRQLHYINLRLTEILLMDTNVAQCVFWLSNLSNSVFAKKTGCI